MYENLVKRLRDKASALDYDGWVDTAASLEEAADAIEALKQTVEHYHGCSEDWYKEACDYKAMLPRWIPVAERLPEEERQVLAYYGFNHGDGYLGMMFMQVLDYYAHDPKPHFQHEGLNGMTVTHWMPLPEPPKEEA